MTELRRRCSPWTMPVLRMGMGVFLAMWGVDKILSTEGSVGIFSHFYGLEVGPGLVQAAGVAEILLGVFLAVGLFRVPAAWIALAVNTVSTVGSWKQILDPWGLLGLTEGGTHLFLASIVVMAANVVIVLNADDPTGTLDQRLGRADGSAEPGGSGPTA